MRPVRKFEEFLAEGIVRKKIRRFFKGEVSRRRGGEILFVFEKACERAFNKR